MNIFLKLAPYLIILALGFGIYYGFNYMSNKISDVEKENQLLINQNNLLKEQLDSVNVLYKINIEQLEQLQKNEQESLNNIVDNNKNVDDIKFDGNRKKMLEKINDYEKCIANNSLKPQIKCELKI